jgi:mannan endo-1,4-beta-mannosidase
VLPKLQQSIDKYYPETKLSMTEYCFGAENHISGGIAQADALGIFASNDVYLATLWSLTDKRDYAYSAINLYTNYNGKGGAFGDTLVQSSTDNIAASSVYSSINGSDDGRLHIILINRDLDKANNFKIDIASDVKYKSASVYMIDSSSSKIKENERIKGINGNSFVYQMPPMSIAHLVLITQDEESAIVETTENTEEASKLEAAVTFAETYQATDSDNLNNSQESLSGETSDEKDGGFSMITAAVIGGCVIVVCAIIGAVFFMSKKT